MWAKLTRSLGREFSHVNAVARLLLEANAYT